LVCDRLIFPEKEGEPHKCKGHGRNIKGKRWNEEFVLTEEEYKKCIWEVNNGMTECWMIPIAEKERGN